MQEPSGESPWYRDGLPFQCSQCGDCCTGAPGYVWVNEAEIHALAQRLGMPVESFEKQYTRKVGIRRTLTEFSNGDCVFFDGAARKCTVYEHRPRQCRTWPFWDSNIKTPEDWARTCQACPGSGKGKVYSFEEIETQRKVIKI